MIKKSKGSKKDQYKCEICDYKCKREETLLTHMNSKHEPQECKVCLNHFHQQSNYCKLLPKSKTSVKKKIKKITEIQDWDEVKIMKSNKIKKKQ